MVNITDFLHVKKAVECVKLKRPF